MAFFYTKKSCTLEISPDVIRAVEVIKKAGKINIAHMETVKIPTQTLAPSFRRPNIVDEKGFQACLKNVCKSAGPKKIHVALPDPCIKVLIKTFTTLPDTPRDIERMLIWQLASSYGIPEKELRVSWENRGTDPDNRIVLVIAMGMGPVIAQYEAAFNTAGMRPVQLAPAGLSRFNFYARELPEEGCIAYLSLFDEYISLFVFSRGVPLFYQTTPKGRLNRESAVNDADLIIQYFNSEFPENPIEKFFISSSIKSEALVARVFENMNHVDLAIFDETRLMPFGNLPEEESQLPFYAAAFGALQKGAVR